MIQEEEVHLDLCKLLQGHGQIIREAVEAHAFQSAENSLAQTHSGPLPLLGWPQLPGEGGQQLLPGSKLSPSQFTCVFSCHF